MTTITFIRHGESLDNLKSIWAGWKDAPLSELGNKQAKALGRAMSNTQFHAIYSSDLLRAHQTAKALLSFQAAPGATIVVNPKLREQHFGVAEGNPWTFDRHPDKSLEEHYKSGIYPVLFEKHEKFPGGESTDDLAKRSEDALKETVFSHLADHREEEGEFRVAITSHGLCIGELIRTLTRLDPEHPIGKSYTGLKNTAWTRVRISLKNPQGPGEPAAEHAETLPRLNVKVDDINNAAHLNSLHTVEEPVDELEAERRAFFGGDAEQAKAASVTNADVSVTVDGTKVIA